MNHRRRLALLAGTFASVFLASCGGGGDSGGDPPPPPASLELPLRQAYAAWIATAEPRERFTVTGSCQGWVTIERRPAAATTLEGVAVSVMVETWGTLNGGGSDGCLVPAIRSNFLGMTTSYYYDLNLALRGALASTGRYAIVSVDPLPLPMMVRAGDKALLATLTRYATSAKTSALGRRDYSYEAQRLSASTLELKFTERDYNTAGSLVRTFERVFHLSASGLTLHSMSDEDDEKPSLQLAKLTLTKD